MASFSKRNHAAEIDFELDAGEEMLRFLRAGAPDAKAQQWPMRCTYGSETYDLIVQRTGSGSRGPLRITWSVAGNEEGV